MGITDKMWDAITTVIKMNDKVERMAGTMKAQQEKVIAMASKMQKKAEAKIIRERLSKELDEFQDCVKSYNLADGEDKKDCELSIMMKLKWNAPFAAFKRWMIRDASDKFPELLKYCQ